MINRIIVLSTLAFALALSINWVMDESDAPPDNLAGNDPDFYMLDATINQFDDNGELQHKIVANRFTHFPLTDLTTMKSPAIKLGNSRASNPWNITSSEGRIIPSTNYREEIVELWNNVLASKADSSTRFIHIQTDSLTVYPERDYAETDDKVYIDNQSGRTTAAGMKAFLDSGKFMFYSTPAHRVTTIFLPN